jgi:hypothetical protein
MDLNTVNTMFINQTHIPQIIKISDIIDNTNGAQMYYVYVANQNVGCGDSLFNKLVSEGYNNILFCNHGHLMLRWNLI